MLGSLREKKIKTILFDFDGTLADTVSAGVATFNKLAERYGFGEITPENEDILRTKGPRGAMKELSVSIFRVPTVLYYLRSGVRDAMPTIGFIAGLREAVLELKSRGYRLGIVTSNSRENVAAFLENHQAPFFDIIQADAGIFNKAKKIKKLMSQEGLLASETIFIGDEIRDVEAAQKNSIPVVAVTWGLNSHAALVAAGADFVVDSPEELVALF